MNSALYLLLILDPGGGGSTPSGTVNSLGGLAGLKPYLEGSCGTRELVGGSGGLSELLGGNCGTVTFLAGAVGLREYNDGLAGD